MERIHKIIAGVVAILAGVSIVRYINSRKNKGKKN